MARGEHQQISSAEVIAAARATIVAPPSPRITIPMPSIRAVKKAAWWTLGIVLFFCALPFIVLGLFEWGMFVADQFYVRHTPDHVALSFGVTFGTWFGVKVLVIAWLWRRDRRRIGATARCRAELAAKTTMAERNPLSGLLRENATHWHVVLAVVRFGVVAAFVVESLIFRAAHYSDHPKDLLTAWTPCLLLAVGLAFMSDWSWAISKAFPVAIVRALRWRDRRYKQFEMAPQAEIAASMAEREGAQCTSVGGICAPLGIAAAESIGSPQGRGGT